MPETKTKKPEAAGQNTLVMAKTGSGQSTSKTKQDGVGPTPVQRQSSASRVLTPNTLPPPRSQDQQIDRQYNSYMYRPGELVWFKRGPAWGLGAVLRRWQTAANQFHYTVQPLSHPYQHPSSMVKSSHADLRPWLAWSVPGYTNDALNHMPDIPRYDTFDWNALVQKRYGNGDPEVDGSILAAKSIDSSFTLLQPGKSVETDQGYLETHYEGMFIGAEKAWVGEPLRLHPGTGTDVLVLHSIIERKSRQARTNTSPAVSLVGDVYELHQTSHSNPSLPSFAAPANNPQLPQRLTEDLTYRNARSIPTQYTASYWKLTATNARFELNDIKGRWYEASLILPILQQAVFEESARKGEIREATLWMNSRGDCINSNRDQKHPRLPRENVSRPTRREAFGRALPANAEIRDGVEPPLPDNVDPALEAMASQSSMEIDPRFDTADNNTSDHIRVTRPEVEHLHADAGLDEFMNIDDMDEQAHVSHTLPGFGQEYSQEPSQGYF